MQMSTFLTTPDGTPSSREPVLLADSSPEDFGKLLTGSETLEYDAGAILIAEGAQDTSLYIIVEGDVEVLVPTEVGWMRVAALRVGSVIGEMAFLDNLPRSARVMARTRCSAVRITRESFREFALREPLIALVFIWDLSRIITFRMRRVERFDAAEVAREEERKTLDAELHDETMADLGSMAVELGFMKRAAQSTTPELVGRPGRDS